MIDLSGQQKAAIVLMQMPDQVASAVLKEMSEAEVSRASRIVAELSDLEPALVKQVMAEFLERVQMVSTVNQGGLEAARRILRERMGAARAEEEIESLLGSRASLPFAFLNGLEPAQIAGFLADEHPQSATVLLAHLPADLAASVLGAMDEARRSDVSVRLARMGKVPPDALAAITKAMSSQLTGLASPFEGGAGGGAGALASVLNHSDRAVERQVLAEMDKLDPDLAEDIRRRLFTFDDVIKLDDRTLQKVARAIPTRTLALALKGSPEEVQQAFLHNLSEGAAKDLTDEIGYLGAVRLIEVEGAQMDVARTVREMEVAGDITVIRESDDVVL